MVGSESREAKSAAASIDMHIAVSLRDSPAVSWFPNSLFAIQLIYSSNK